MSYLFWKGVASVALARCPGRGCMLQKWGPTCEKERIESHESREIVLLLVIIALFTARSEIGRTGFLLLLLLFQNNVVMEFC